MSGATPKLKSFVIMKLTVLLCLPRALSVEFSCGPNAIHNVTATPSTVYQLEGREILLVAGGPVSNFVFWQRRRTWNSNSTDIPQTEPAFRYELTNLRILSMTSDFDGTQFSYRTSVSANSDPPVFTSNWTTTIIGYPPTITGVPSETTFIEGPMKKTITFNNSGTPNPDIICWNESSTQVVDHVRFKCTSGRLVFGPLFESDEGQYTVKSVNCFGSNTRQMNIIVNRGPTIRGDFTTRSVECGGDVDVSYSIDGDPTPDFHWYFKGSPYHPVTQPTASQLMIRNVTFKNTGVYTLKVNNSAGEKSVSVRLLLNELKTVRFTQQPFLSVSDHVGCEKPFKLICAARGPNVQSVNWRGDIQNRSTVITVQQFDYCTEREIVSTLTINGYSETGLYRFTCHATSTFSSQSVISDDTFVQVWCQADSPTVRVFSKTNNSVTLSIFRPGYRGDLPITKYSVVYRNVTVSVHPSNDSVLVPIKDLTSNTIYKFEVSVHNGYGASEIATVTVKTDGVPGQILIQQYLRFGSTEIQCKSANLHFPLPDNGGVDINAYSVSLTDIRRGDTTEFLSVSNNNTRIYVDHLKENTAYTLQIRGRNKYGLGPSSDVLLFQTANCEEDTRLTAAVGVLASLLCLTILVAVYLGYRLRLVRASTATEMKESTEASVDPPAPYATVPDSRSRHHQSETLTSSPLYEAATVQANPAYGVVKNDPTGRR